MIKNMPKAPDTMKLVTRSSQCSWGLDKVGAPPSCIHRQHKPNEDSKQDRLQEGLHQIAPAISSMDLMDLLPLSGLQVSKRRPRIFENSDVFFFVKPSLYNEFYANKVSLKFPEHPASEIGIQTQNKTQLTTYCLWSHAEIIFAKCPCSQIRGTCPRIKSSKRNGGTLIVYVSTKRMYATWLDRAMSACQASHKLKNENTGTDTSMPRR